MESEVNDTEEMLELMSKVEKLIDYKTQQIAGTDVRDLRELSPGEKEFVQQKLKELNLEEE